MTNTLALEYGPKHTIRIAPDGGWQQPAGPYGRGGTLPRFARALIAAGHDPATPIDVTRNGTRIWAKPGTLGYWAGLSIVEPDGASVQARRYQPMTFRRAAHAA